MGWLLFLVVAVLTEYESNAFNFVCVNESQLVYTYTGEVSVGGTTAQCLRNLQDGLIFPGIMTEESLNVSVQLTFNNLISVEELENTVKLDMLFWLAWKDERLNMPAMWSRLPNVSSVDLSEYLPIVGAQGFAPEFWVPDVFFPNAQSILVPEKYLKLYPQGEIRYLQHMVLTLLQSQFDYHEYPYDTQNIEITFMPIASGTQMVNFYPPQVIAVTGIAQPAVTFAENADGEVIFKQNPLWAFNDVYSITFETVQLNEYFAPRSTCTTSIQIKRIPVGIVDRLAYPIFLLAVIAGLGFWADTSQRINLTLTILLAISALYIIIFSLVPFVGYLTLFDRYIITMFTLLVAMCVIHQLTAVLQNDTKIRKYPLRMLAQRLITLSGRICFLPTAFSVYIAYFHSSELTAYVFEIMCVSILSILISVREYFGAKKNIQEIICMLEAKVLNDKLTLSKQETKVYNLWHGNKLDSLVTEDVMRQNMLGRKSIVISSSTNVLRGLGVGLESDVHGVELSKVHQPQE